MFSWVAVVGRNAIPSPGTNRDWKSTERSAQNLVYVSEVRQDSTYSVMLTYIRKKLKHFERNPLNVRRRTFIDENAPFSIAAFAESS